ncbi:histidine kinase [Streptomyces sp. NPDC002734]|uniref:sensor histidine kinase n=1 Tax=Streptomyces sp. NPDC002734 TaxID=3154426 RepID=UPI0033281050
MAAPMSRLLGRRARLRWIHLILGGALAMPYVLAGSLVVGPLIGASGGDGTVSLSLQLAAFALALPLAALTALLPPTRPLESAAVRWLCGVGSERLAYGPARALGERTRTATWFTLHLAVGSVVAAMTLAVPPFALLLILLPFVPALRSDLIGGTGRALVPDHSWALALTPVAGILLLTALAACAAGCGTLLARWAPALLGPSPEERIAAAEARAADLALRNRLARELHDSIGHALSAVTLQATAARRVLERDPHFAREALAAIEDTTRRTLAELDTVLGVLRDSDAPGTAPAPTLATDLDGLLHRTRAAGPEVTATVTADLMTLPPPVSREAYRIVQEGLGNALRHAGERTTVTLRIEWVGDHLHITLDNPPAATRAPRSGGGHGLPGIAERARLLGGTTQAGPTDGVWRLHVRLPLKETA